MLQQQWDSSFSHREYDRDLGALQKCRVLSNTLTTSIFKSYVDWKSHSNFEDVRIINSLKTYKKFVSRFREHLENENAAFDVDLKRIPIYTYK